MTTMPSLAAAHLEHARSRTLALVDGFDDHDLGRQVSPLMSPLVWDLAHIGHYEELWLLRSLAGATADRPALRRRVRRLQAPASRPADACRSSTRATHAPTSPTCASASLDGCSTTSTLDGDADPLLADGFVYGMVVQHEHQHDETMLATIQLHGDARARPGAGGAVRCASPVTVRRCRRGRAARRPVRHGHGRRAVGVRQRAPRPRGRASRRSASTARRSPTRRTLEFIADGGYDDPRLWTDDGLEVAHGGRPRAPAVLASRTAGRATDWTVLRFGRRLELGRPRPSPCSTCAGTRPTRSRAGPASGSPPRPSGSTRRRGAPTAPSAATRGATATPTTRSPTSARPASAPTRAAAARAARARSACEQMVGDVWEWTASDFDAYPGFRSFPYREYSEVFFRRRPEYKVLRGGSWATHPSAMRTTFRNWDYPIRRQIFSGFRCARRLTGLTDRVPPPRLPRAARRRSRRCCSTPPHSLVDQARRAALPAERAGRTPTGSGVGWYAAGARRRGPAALPQRRRRSGTTPGSPSSRRARRPPPCWPPSALASPGAPVEVSGNAPVRRRPVAVLAERRRPRALRTASATSCGRRVSRAAPPPSRASPTPRCCSR